MGLFLNIARAVDAVTEGIGKAVGWFIRAAIVVSAANAVVRQTLSISSNGYLEAQCYLYAAAFLMAAQGLSEIIKKIAVMTGHRDDPTPFVSAHYRGRTDGAGDCQGGQAMMQLVAMDMAPIMVASLVVFLLPGYPVAFSLVANGAVFFVIGVWLAPLSEGTITLDWPLLYALPERFWGGMQNDTLLAIPFFTFMGIVLARSGMAQDLRATVGQLSGRVRGGECGVGDLGADHSAVLGQE